MKKFFTLLAGFFMTVSAVAQDEFPAPVTWSAQKGVEPENKTVILAAEDESPIITCEFLDGVVHHNGRDPQEFVWTFSQGAYATAWDLVNNKVDGNGMEVRFTATYGGTLEIILDASLAANKSLNMYINDNPEITVSATVGEETIESGAEHAEIAAKTPIVYEIQKGLTYNFYCAGTKWRFKSFTFTATNNDDPDPVDGDKKIAVISPAGEDDPLLFAVQEGFEATFISDATDVTLESLQEYDALLVSNNVTADSPFADVLRSAVAYQPMVNLSAALIEKWGLGTVTNTESNTITVSDENLENALFTDLAYDEGLELVAEGTLPVVTPGAYLADDDVLATVGEAPYILVHNAARNAHILMPFTAGVATDGENMTGLVANALKVAAKSKKAVTKAANPKFTAAQENLATTVTISGPEASVIRYAIGADAEVNAESAVYTEPILFTEVATIKAVASVDGFLDSDVAIYEVPIAAKAERPVITVTPGEGKSAVITIAAAEEGAEIHYSFKGQDEASRTVAAKTAVYTEPVTVYEPTMVYAFVVGENLLQSDLEEMGVDIPGIDASNIRLDVISHFTGGTPWRSPKLDGVAVEGAPLAANVYMGVVKNGSEFGLGSSNSVAWSRYTDKVLEEEVKEQAKNEDGSLQVDEDGNPVMVVVKNAVYEVNPESRHEMTCDEEPDWKYVSEGQSGLMETGLGNDAWIVSGETKGFIDATDLVSSAPTKGGLSWKGVGKSNGLSDEATVRLESTKAFTAPFDIEIFLASSGSQASVDVCISKDGKEWQVITTALGGPQKRNIKKTRVAVEKAGDWYICINNPKNSPQMNDVIIYNNGELSKEYTGIAEVIADEAAEVISVEYYNINGMRIAEPENGFYIMRATLSNGNVVVKKVVK